MNLFKKICFEKGENINVIWKGNKRRGGYKDSLQSDRDRYYTAKNYITT